MTRISLLGEQQMRSDPGALPVSVSGRAGALLASLVLHEGTHQERSDLAQRLWPDSTTSQARTNLRRELHQLRAMIGPVPSLVVSDSALGWHGGSDCPVDVLDFRAHRHAAWEARATGDDLRFRRHAEAALALYRGDLLPGVEDDWLAPEREGLRREHVELVLETAAARRTMGDGGGAAELARAHIRLEPLDEAGYRLLMEVQADAGKRAEAMSTYHRCAAVLEQDLGVEPGESITGVFERLLAGERASADVAVAPLQSAEGDRDGADASRGLRSVRRSAPSMVGRAGELATLGRLWGDCTRGGAGLVLIQGDPGVGKSRLAAAMAREAQRDGAVVATARCFGHSGRSPLAPVAEWLRSPELAAGGRRLDELWRTEIHRLLPSGPADRGAAVLHDPAEAWGRQRFYEALARAVRSPAGPVLLVLDDVQWCDAETLAWLPDCICCVREPGLMILGTARSQGLEVHPEVEGALRGLRAAGLLQDITLSPLDRAATAELAAQAAGRALLPGEARAVHAVTAGYPLHIIEAGHQMREAGADSTGFQLSDLGGVLGRRLGEASAAAQETARLASAVGRDFALDLLHEAGELGTDELVGAVDELWRLRIVRADDNTYSFTHELLREAAYGSVSPAHRWLLHRRLAQALEHLHAGDLDPVSAQLAEQYDRGGRPERAVHFYRRAAAVAMDVYACSEALTHLRRALRLIRQRAPGRDRDEAELVTLRSMAAPLTTVQGYASAELLDTLERAAILARTRGEAALVVSCLVAQFAVRFVQGRMSSSYAIAREALEESAAAPELAGQAHFAMGGAAVALGRYAMAAHHFATGLDSSLGARAYILGTDLDVHCRAWASHAHWFLGEEAEAVRLGEDALRCARQVHHPFSLAVALAYAAVLHQLRGDVAATRDAVEQLRDVCGRYDIAYYNQWAVILEGWATPGADGIALIRRGIGRLRSDGAFARMPYWLVLLADALARDGRPTDAAGVIDAAASAVASSEEICWAPLVEEHRARLAGRQRSGGPPQGNGGGTPGP